MRGLAKPGSFIAVFACLVVAGCSFTKFDAGNFYDVNEDKGRVITDAPAYRGVTPIRVGFVDSLEREEYTLFRSTGGQAEMIYLETRPERTSRIVIDFVKLISDTLPMWRFHQGHELIFDKSVAVKNNIASFWMQTFRQADTGRACVGFYGNWDQEVRDIQYRPTKVLFGYHCVPKGSNLDTAAAEAFVKSLDIRGVTVPLRIKTAYEIKDGDPPMPPKEEQIANLVRAQDGAAGGVAGMPEFPLLAARRYNEGNGCRKIGC